MSTDDPIDNSPAFGPGGAPLSDADARALDALIDAEFDLDAVEPALRGRAERVGALLGMLEPADAEGGADLAQRTMAYVRAGGAASRDKSLSDADAEALNALVAAGWSASAVGERHAKRARRAERLLSTIGDVRIDRGDAQDLVDRTVDLVRAYRERERARAIVEASSGRRGFRLNDLVAVAAILLIGTAVFWPIFGGAQASLRRAQCAQNLHNAAIGFDLYGGANQGELPMAQSSLLRVAPGQAPWWDVGDPERSHSANLYQLVAGGYANMHDLACPGNHLARVKADTLGRLDWTSREEISYSYQLFGGRQAHLHDARRIVLLTDKSPVIAQALRGETLRAELRSPNHGGAGQHVLRSDGSVEWLETSETRGGDNLWLPQRLERVPGATLTGRELPRTLDDAFVGP